MWKVICFAVALSALFIVIQAQESCHQCTQDIQHSECLTPEINDFSRTCNGTTGNPNATCFTTVNEVGFVVRGCFNQLDNATALNCDSETCQICSGNNCNKDIFPDGRMQCHRCSGGVNSTCSGIMNTTMTICPVYQRDDRCYIARPNGNFERGCLSSAPQNRCERDEACFICIGNGCNFVDYNSAIHINSMAKLIPFIVLSIIVTVFNN